MPRTLSVVEMTGFLVRFFSFEPLESLKRWTFRLISLLSIFRTQMTLSRPFTIRKSIRLCSHTNTG
jgi:hypothetical protein